jgi:CheY-like chemotaxis protein
MAFAHDSVTKRLILILEDEIVTARYLQRVLKAIGHHVIAIAADGQEALRFLAESKADLLIADVGLAGDIDGIEVAIRARDLFQVPTIFLTAYSDPETVQRSKGATPKGYVIKPFAEQELRHLIDNSFTRQGQDASVTTGARLARLQSELENLWQSLPAGVQEEHKPEFARILIILEDLANSDLI